MRILIIEDENAIARFLKKGLIAEAFIVDSAGTAEKGLSLVHSKNYDLIILDIKLPDADGIGICEGLRKEGKTFPILMLSTIGDSDTKTFALNMGADDYMSKPFSFRELLARVQALLRRRKRIMKSHIRISDLEINTLSHQVKRGDTSFVLSKKEFALLKYLAENVGIVLTRSMLLEHVWHVYEDSFTNTVDVHIRFLRKKIDDKKFGKKLLHTVHGRGYMMSS